MRGGVRVLAGVVALAAFVGVAAAAAPVVSAGLDQNVVEGDTVYLDGGGTHVPDGKLAELEWTIETPDGRTITPACVDCETTSFTPTTTGQYDVTLTATSESGEERSDTLYVDVEAASSTSTGGAAPAVNATTDTGGSVGSDSSGCWLEHEGDGGTPMDENVCSNVGMIENFETSSTGDSITHVIFDGENPGFAEKYSGAERVDGIIRVPIESVTTETEELNEQAENIGGTNETPSGDSGSGGNSGPSDEAEEEIGDSGGADVGSCNNVPSSWC